MSLSSFKTVCLAAPVIPQVALIDTPSTSADITAMRLSVQSRFMCIMVHNCQYFVNILTIIFRTIAK